MKNQILRRGNISIASLCSLTVLIFGSLGAGAAESTSGSGKTAAAAAAD